MNCLPSESLVQAPFIYLFLTSSKVVHCLNYVNGRKGSPYRWLDKSAAAMPGHLDAISLHRQAITHSPSEGDNPISAQHFLALYLWCSPPKKQLMN